jgi:hypothetical protein
LWNPTLYPVEIIGGQNFGEERACEGRARR